MMLYNENEVDWFTASFEVDYSSSLITVAKLRPLILFIYIQPKQEFT